MADKPDFKALIASEYRKCAADPVYFMKKYCTIQEPVKGRIKFALYDYQVECVETFERENKTIVLKGRQIGLSTVVACYSLWMMLFHKDKNILVIAIKQDTAKNLITKVKFAFDNLPPWLQVPCYEDNKLGLRFKNGSQIKAVASSENAARSEALSLLVLDEGAFIKNANDIWISAQPALATGGKAIILSTPNGTGNFFYDKYIEAEENIGMNKPGVFFPIKLDWRRHPDRDQAWRDLQDELLGPREARQEYDAEFIGSGNTVIDGDIIEWYKKEHMREPELKLSPAGDLWVWQQPIYGRRYVLVGDVARGENSETGDYSAFHVLDLEKCEQVAEYRGRIPTTEYADLMVGVATQYNDALLIIENATVGWAAIQHVINRGYRNLFYMIDDAKYLDPNKRVNNKLNRQDNKAVAGFTTSLRTRPLIISKLEEYTREKTIIIHSQRTLNEFNTFIWENGKAQAAEGKNDDLTMSLAIGLWVRDTALVMHDKNNEYTKLALDNMSRVNSVDAVFTANQMIDPYKMNIMGQEEDLRWLLEG